MTLQALWAGTGFTGVHRKVNNKNGQSSNKSLRQDFKLYQSWIVLNEDVLTYFQIMIPTY